MASCSGIELHTSLPSSFTVVLSVGFLIRGLCLERVSRYLNLSTTFSFVYMAIFFGDHSTLIQASRSFPKRTFWDCQCKLFGIRCLFCHPANSVKALKGGSVIIALHAKLSGAVYCYRSCLCVCNRRAGIVCVWVCYHDNSKLCALIFTKLDL